MSEPVLCYNHYCYWFKRRFVRFFGSGGEVVEKSRTPHVGPCYENKVRRPRG